MKQDKLFEECLSKVDPEAIRLMGLPTDEELEVWYEDMTSQSSAKYIRNLAAQKLKEQNQIDAYLADIKRQRDEYYYELQKLRQEKVEWLEKACRCLEKYMERLGYIDEWCRSGEDDFCKAMEE